MKKILEGKKLLILGATTNEIALVKRAQLFGAYVIVTDNHENYELAPAKYVADEAWNISWSDIDTLEQRCISQGVNGVTAGFSEFRIENTIKLCARLNLPCYATMDQLEITRDKIKFKEECRKYGVPVVKEYASVSEVNNFPVIVKPVDRAGSIGISVATDRETLERAYVYAMEMSICKQVIIEDFIYRGDKVDFYYAVEDGEIQLISSCDTINASANGFDKVVQSAWLYPERHLPAALDKVDEKIRKMIAGMGIRYGCIFFSGFVDENLEYTFFECGFRLEGGNQHEYVFRRGLMNYQDIFIFHALTGSTKDIPRNGPFNPDLKCVTINLYAKEGTISAIEGMDQIAKLPDCSLSLVHARLGQECRDDKAILTKIGMFSVCSTSAAKLLQNVETAYALLSVRNESGEDMLYDRIDTSLIESWWN